MKKLWWGGISAHKKKAYIHKIALHENQHKKLQPVNNYKVVQKNKNKINKLGVNTKMS